MKERDVQIQYKKNAVKSDKKWEEQVKLNDEKAFKEDQEKEEKRRRERVALAEDHLKQYVCISERSCVFLVTNTAFL
jgi:hypothetical protein